MSPSGPPASTARVRDSPGRFREHVRALVQAAEQILRRHAALLEHQLAGVGAAHAEFVELLRGRESGEGLFDDEGGDAALARLRIGLGIDDQHIGIRAIGDPHLMARETEMIAMLRSAQLHGGNVGAGAGLGHGQGAHVCAVHQLRQIAVPLRIAAMTRELIDAEIGVRSIGEPDRAAGARDLFHDDDVRQVAQVGAAPALRHGHAEQAQRPQLGPEVARKLVSTIDFIGQRRDPLAREATHL